MMIERDQSNLVCHIMSRIRDFFTAVRCMRQTILSKPDCMEQRDEFTVEKFI